MQKQKYKRGNVVKIKVGEHGGEKAIIEYSYSEKFPPPYYGGDNFNSYSVTLLRDGNSIAWFEEELLLFVEEGGEHLFQVAQKKASKLTKKRTSLKWIVENWEKIRSSPSSDTILFLFDELNLKSSFLQNGEFAILYSDWGRWVHSIDYIMTAKDENEVMALFKPGASESIKQSVLALFKKIRAVTPHHRGGCYGKEGLERDFSGAYPRANCRGKRPVG